jgi:hypothetical protein
MLTEKLHAQIVSCISNFEMIGGNVWRNFRWTQAEVEFLNFCLNQKHLSTEDFYEAVERRILAIGHKMYKQATPSVSIRRSREPQYADHVTSPEALAFAIAKGKFTPVQLDAIAFDHGDKPETFMKGKTKTLVEDVMMQLMADVRESSSMQYDVECCHHD